MDTLSNSQFFPSKKLITWLLGIIFITALWFYSYGQLDNFATFILSLTSFDRSSHLGESIHFFFYDMPKVMLLLAGVVFFMGIIQTFFSPEKTRSLLAGKRLGLGNTLAALLGIVTPFCSCSAVPLFIGFLSAGVPLGITFSFLIAAPMVNEIALILLFGLFDSGEYIPEEGKTGDGCRSLPKGASGVSVGGKKAI